MARRVNSERAFWSVVAIFFLVTITLAASLLDQANLSASFAAGLAGACLPLLYEQNRIARRVQVRRDQFDELVASIKGIEDPDKEAQIVLFLRSVGSTQDADQQKIPEVRNLAWNRFLEQKRWFDTAATGKFEMERQGRPVFFGFFDDDLRILRATSGDGDLDWWESALGSEYLRLHRRVFERRDAALGREVLLERIFVLNGPPCDRMDEVMRRNVSAGVDVWWLLASDLSEVEDLHVNMTIFDERFIHQDYCNKSGTTTRYDYSTNEPDIAAGIERFRQLRRQVALRRVRLARE